MKRRDFLQYCGSLTAHMALTSVFAEALTISSAHGDQVSIVNLRSVLDPKDALILVPSDVSFAKYQISFNKRTMITPNVRVMCRTPKAVAIALNWAEENKVPLAMRSGGHSFEGFSQSSGIVIDTRPMAQIEVAGNATTFTVGAGTRLGQVYETLAPRGVVIPAGSCPFVGVTGHTTGGGYGLIARPFGLACDSLLSAEIVTADGQVRIASDTSNSDLFWALRGAGGGSYGVITKMNFRTHQVKSVYVFALAWKLKLESAVPLMQAWQQWAPEAPNGINALMRLSKDKDGMISVRCYGQSIGTESVLQNELAQLTAIATPDKKTVQKMSFIDSVHRFAGEDKESDSIYMKGKSDILKSVMSVDDLRFFLKALPIGQLTVMFDAYGGAIRNKRDVDTAFAHRENTICSMQYYSEWSNNSETADRLKTMRKFHDSLRPYMGTGAYVNYCDLDIPKFADAYWGKNLDRLIKIKNDYDPNNLFKHAQSVPLRR